MNAINWFEIPVADFARAIAFYERVLAAKLHVDDSFPGMRLAVFPYTEPGVGGALFEHPEARPHADGVRVYLNGGDDLSPLLARAVEAGGQVVMPKTRLRDDIGYIGLFRDSEGNVIGLHSMH
ncbi:VOC family protein [Propionivibrio sp.]|uniref:VOC family protein n=1 Tax=Propionivibrio sp. TaxID=2212460 RepID=UPI0039E3CB2B